MTGVQTCALPIYEEIGMDLEDVAGQRLVPGGHAADGPGFEHAVAARRDGPAVQRSAFHYAGSTLHQGSNRNNHLQAAYPFRQKKPAIFQSLCRIFTPFRYQYGGGPGLPYFRLLFD